MEKERQNYIITLFIKWINLQFPLIEFIWSIVFPSCYFRRAKTLQAKILTGYGNGAAGQTRNHQSEYCIALETISNALNWTNFLQYFRDWKFEHPKRIRQGYSMRLARVGKNSLFSREVIYSLLLTNVLSLLLGAGVG